MFYIITVTVSTVQVAGLQQQQQQLYARIRYVGWVVWCGVVVRKRVRPTWTLGR